MYFIHCVTQEPAYARGYHCLILSTKSEVNNNNILHCRQPLPQETGTENLLKFGHVVFEIYDWSDGHRQTYRLVLIIILCTPARAKK